jgi:hypothetical protein
MSFIRPAASDLGQLASDNPQLADQAPGSFVAAANSAAPDLEQAVAGRAAGTTSSFTPSSPGMGLWMACWLRPRVGARGIRVNAVRSGFIDTDMLRYAWDVPSGVPFPIGPSEENNVPLGRVGQPSEQPLRSSGSAPTLLRT